MEKDAPLCPECKQPMILVKKFETKPRGRKKSKYRIRRFGCSMCDIQQTIWADGFVENMQAKETAAEALRDLDDYKGEPII